MEYNLTDGKKGQVKIKNLLDPREVCRYKINVDSSVQNIEFKVSESIPKVMYAYYLNNSFYGYPVQRDEWSIDATDIGKVQLMVIPNSDENEIRLSVKATKERPDPNPDEHPKTGKYAIIFGVLGCVIL